MVDIVKENKIIELPGVSLGMILQVQVEELGMAHSRLIGIDPGQFLIVKTPTIAEIATQLYEKNHVVVRYFSSGWVHAFRCTLLSLIKEPARLAILSYPESIEKINIRKHDRVDCNIPAVALIQGENYGGVVKNISAGGLAMEIDKKIDEALPPVSIHDVISLTIYRDGGQTTAFKTIVRNIKMDRTVMLIGMEFYFPSAERKENREGNQWLDDLISENI
jgi:c-di-GMP-binding flagellar brake protein YcgR